MLNFEDLKETIDINLDDLKGNRMLVNELLIDDIMIGLGYNKKRDKTVKRYYDNNIDWKAEASSSRLAIKVYAIDEELSDDELNNTLTFCTEKRFSILIVTNGKDINIKRFNKETFNYIDVCTIDITSEITDSNIEILNAISKDTFDLKVIDKIALKRVFSYDEIKEAMKDGMSYLIEMLSKKLNDSSDDAVNQYKNHLNTLLNENTNDNIETSTESNTESNDSNTEQLNLELDTLKNSCNELKSEIDALIEKNNELKAELENKETEQQQLNSKISSLNDSLSNIKEQNEQLKSELDTLKNSENNQESNDDSLEELKSEVLKLTEEIQNNKNDIDNKDETIKSLQEKLNNVQKELKNTQDKLTKLENAPSETKSNNTDDGNYTEEIDSYREQIGELTIKLSEATEQVEILKKQLDDAKDEINNMSGADRLRAQELLDMIEDNPELDRHYVGVINTELIQLDDINTFVGRALQALYTIKSFEASQYIFNGDIFKLVQPAKRNDIIMNNKQYDLDLNGVHEDETLNKLRIVFSHFDDVIFECKKIGTLKDKSDTHKNNINTSSFHEGFESDGQETSDNWDTEEDESDAIDIMGESDDTDEEEDIKLDDSFLNMDVPSSSQDNLLVAQLLHIDELIWTEEPVNFNNIKYLGSNLITFNINMNNEEISNDSLLCKCIDAVLAVEAYKGNSKIVAKLKQKDFSTVNNFLKLYTEEYASYPRINGTKYVVAGIESVQQVASVLSDICNEMEIDTTELFIYFSVNTDSDFIVSNYGYAEDAVQLREVLVYNKSEEPNETTAIIKGNMLGNIVVTKNSLQVHKEVLVKAVAIKTKYLAETINDRDEYVNIIRKIINKAIDSGIDIETHINGNVIGENKKIVSFNESSVGENAAEINTEIGDLYVADVEDWQVTHSLIKVHTSLFNDTQIAIKNIVNTEAINFYQQEFETAEPSLSLAIFSFVDYVASNIKN